MIEIPENVEDWTYGRIVDLIHEGYDENDILELKKDVNANSNRFTESVCAFANTNGGTVIFGIDNDREKPLHLTDRICGLDDSDQLKRNIVDKIKNIEPNIPIEDLIFRKSNIKLPNKKVIVILQVRPSSFKPHQYNHIFRKRLSDGNEPMSVEEIKNLILTSSKRRHNELLVVIELGVIKENFEKAKHSILKKEYLAVVPYVEDQDMTSLIHFQHNLSHLYSSEIPHEISEILANTEKLSVPLPAYQNIFEGKSVPAMITHSKKQGYDEPLQYVIDLFLTRIDIVLKSIDNLSKLLHHQIQMPKIQTPIKHIENLESTKDVN